MHHKKSESCMNKQSGGNSESTLGEVRRCDAGPINRPRYDASLVRRSDTRPVRVRSCERTLPGILVPVDFSPASIAALDYALVLAGRLHASILLLHVMTPRYAGGLSSRLTRQQLAEQAKGRALLSLQELKATRSQGGVPIRVLVRDGLPGLEIMQVAESMNANLIVIGRRPRSFVGRWLLGSVSNEVVDIASCPILIVKSARKVSA